MMRPINSRTLQVPLPLNSTIDSDVIIAKGPEPVNLNQKPYCPLDNYPYQDLETELLVQKYKDTKAALDSIRTSLIGIGINPDFIQ
jgi:hypothetical protein